MDPVVRAYAAEAGDRLASRGDSGRGRDDEEKDSDPDDLLELLDEVDDSAYRERRLQQLKSEVDALKSLSEGHGTLSEVDEQQLLELTTSIPRVVAHFYQPDFAKCKAMDAHLERVARRYPRTRFVRVKAQQAAFLVTKLKVQVLPCVIAFVDAVSPGRIVGFEGLRLVRDDFTTASLEDRLGALGVIDRRAD